MDFKKLKKSFVYAMRGIAELWQQEQNFRLEILAGVLVLGLAYSLHVSTIAKAILVLVIMLVLGSEAMNTVFENLLDGTSRAMNPHFRIAKDIMAGITLVASLGAIVVGLIIFYPYLKYLIN